MVISFPYFILQNLKKANIPNLNCLSMEDDSNDSPFEINLSTTCRW